jgi:MerR HTH family regulatory protein
MDQNLTIQQLAAATNLSRTQIDQWISRGHFRPKNAVEIGKARAFTIDDAVALGAMAELVRIGMPPALAASHVQHVYQYSDDDTLLVVTQGPIDTAVSDGKGKSLKFYDPDRPTILTHIIRSQDLAGLAADPNVRSMSVVNLSELAKRVFKAVGTG